MTAKIKPPFKANAIYYLKEEGWKLKFIEQGWESKRYIFKVLDHDDPNDDWIEYSSYTIEGIVKTKKEITQRVEETEARPTASNDEQGNVSITVEGEG